MSSRTKHSAKELANCSGVFMVPSAKQRSRRSLKARASLWMRSSTVSPRVREGSTLTGIPSSIDGAFGHRSETLVVEGGHQRLLPIAQLSIHPTRLSLRLVKEPPIASSWKDS